MEFYPGISSDKTGAEYGEDLNRQYRERAQLEEEYRRVRNENYEQQIRQQETQRQTDDAARYRPNAVTVSGGISNRAGPSYGYYALNNSSSDNDFWQVVGWLLGVLVGLAAVIAATVFLLNTAKYFFPYVFNFATTLLSKAYTGLFITPIQGGQYTFHLVSSYSTLLAILAVFFYLCVVVAFLWVMTTGLGEILGINKFIALGGVYVAPLTLYAVCILALDIGSLGQYVLHKVPTKPEVASPSSRILAYVKSCTDRDPSSAYNMFSANTYRSPIFFGVYEIL